MFQPVSERIRAADAKQRWSPHTLRPLRQEKHLAPNDEAKENDGRENELGEAAPRVQSAARGTAVPGGTPNNPAPTARGQAGQDAEGKTVVGETNCRGLGIGCRHSGKTNVQSQGGGIIDCCGCFGQRYKHFCSPNQ